MQLPEHDRGFTLIEVLIAMTILTVVALGVATLVTVATKAAQTARSLTACTMLAVQKMEQLRSLTWTFEDDDVTAPPVSDTSTDLSYDPPQSGGTGLTASPAGALDRNTPGYVDFLDANGRWIGTGATAPDAAVFVRRWSIEPVSLDPADTLMLHVLVTRAVVERRIALRAGDHRPVLAGDALLATVTTRRLP